LTSAIRGRITALDNLDSRNPLNVKSVSSDLAALYSHIHLKYLIADEEEVEELNYLFAALSEAGRRKARKLELVYAHPAVSFTTSEGNKRRIRVLRADVPRTLSRPTLENTKRASVTDRDHEPLLRMETVVSVPRMSSLLIRADTPIERKISEQVEDLAERIFTNKETAMRVSRIAQALIINEMKDINLGDEANRKLAADSNREGYHNQEHAIDVVKTCMDLAARLNISEKDKELLFIAAAGHDAGFEVKYDKNEVAGAEITKKLLLQQGYSSRDIGTVSDIIVKGTTTLPLEEGKLGFQQKPETQLEKIISLADVYNFFRVEGEDRNFVELGAALNREIANKNGKAYVGPTPGSDGFAIQLLKNYPVQDAGYDRRFLLGLEIKRRENIMYLEERQQMMRAAA
jgi:hypothetical protein